MFKMIWSSDIAELSDRTWKLFPNTFSFYDIVHDLFWFWTEKSYIDNFPASRIFSRTSVIQTLHDIRKNTVIRYNMCNDLIIYTLKWERTVSRIAISCRFWISYVETVVADKKLMTPDVIYDLIESSAERHGFRNIKRYSSIVWSTKKKSINRYGIPIVTSIPLQLLALTFFAFRGK